ncbi:MAG: DUF2130 domain-containing protein [Phycisphaerae bacterium]|nr:DUF2130 domain-containing protein [Phycisphaerae bacterium]
MNDPEIQCPNCGKPFRLTESLAAPYIEKMKRQTLEEAAKREAEFAARERAHLDEAARLENEKAALAQQRAEEEARVRAGVEAGRATIEQEARQRAKADADAELRRRDEELTALRERQKEAEAKLDAAAAERRAAEKLKQQAEDTRRETDLLVKRQTEEQVAARLATVSAQAAAEAVEKVRAESAALERKAREEAESYREQLRRQAEKLAEAQTMQAEAMRLRQEAEEAKRETAIAVERQVSERIAAVEERAVRRAMETHELKHAEKDKIISDMRRQMEDMQRKAETVSQQLQGEVQEVSLEASLRQAFQFDLIEEVGKGEFGGDAVQTVRLPGGGEAGRMLWESKRTERWSAAWLPKLREDARRAGAEVPILVTQAMPRDFDTFGLIDGVWVCAWRYAVPLASSLRQGLLAAAQARQAREGQQTKMSLVYEYLTGPEFRARLEALVESYETMQEDLEKEKKAMTAHWSKRAKQLERALEAAAGIGGDVQGIVGRAFNQIEGLDLKALGGGER